MKEFLAAYFLVYCYQSTMTIPVMTVGNLLLFSKSWHSNLISLSADSGYEMAKIF